MRRILLTYFLFAMLPAWCQLEHVLLPPRIVPDRLAEYTLQHYELRGPVQSCKYHYFDANFVDGRIQKVLEAQNPNVDYPNFMAFTPNGFVESTIVPRDLAGTINFKDTLLFNAEGMPVRMTRYFRDGSIKYYESFEYVNGKMTRWMYHRRDRIQQDLVCSYSDDGRILAERETDFYHPEPFDTFYSESDTSDRVIAERFYEYDELGRLVKRVNGTLYTAYSYLSDGKLQNQIFIDEEGVVTTQKTSGDSLIYAENTTKGLHHLFIKRYNEQGDLVETRTYYDGSYAHRDVFEYTYDEKGNWITRCFGRLDSPYPTYWCDERTIEYFE